jgi:cell division initiation protein
MLTPLDIRRQEFPQRFKGYSTDDVDQFLDVVADDMEKLTTERNQLTDRVAALEQQLTEFRRIEESMRSALVTAEANLRDAADRARQNADATQREAEVKAQSIVGEAEARSREIISEAEGRRRALLLENEALESQRSFAISKFRSLLDDQRGVLDAHMNARPGATSGSRPAPLVPAGSGGAA